MLMFQPWEKIFNQLNQLDIDTKFEFPADFGV